MLANNLSANTLFHFTPSLTNLLGILMHNFYPRYSLEDMNHTKPRSDKRIYGIPMVSFCDIPLSQIRNHIQTYGRYAIGLTKGWAQSHGITPVMYLYPDSQSARAQKDLFTSILSHIDKKAITGETIPKQLTYSSFFLKRYEGKLYRNGKFSKEDVRFYDEREWRYVPPFSLFDDKAAQPYLNSEAIQDKTKHSSSNALLEQVTSLAFEPRYIRYLIVDKESEVLEFLDQILAIKGGRFPPDDLRLLTTRIISMEQILEDF
jgi:Putative abortive phage resistance protein AbiGi, antitoxin